ncbi:MAG: hypothetical protein SF182_21175, partial [Deltaproteobacteria bacterium]|nr:hypothetical protein [Deltaproteobacteria bacterium]
MSGGAMRTAACALLALALAAAAAPPASAAPMQTRYLCRADDASWELLLDGRGGRLSRLGTGGGAAQELAGSLTRFDQLTPAWAMWRGHTLAGAYALVATLRSEACSLPSGGDPQPYRSLIAFPDGSVGSGCCAVDESLDVARAPRARFDAKPADDWSRGLAELLPAVRACLAVARTAERVTYAGPAADGSIAVRLVAADGARTDCRVDAAAAQPAQ